MTTEVEPLEEPLRPLSARSRMKIVRLVCGGDSECDMPCDGCAPEIHQAVDRVLNAIKKAGCVVMEKAP